jgi:hypothetical protein
MTGEKERGIILIDYRSLRIYLDGLPPAGKRPKPSIQKRQKAKEVA